MTIRVSLGRIQRYSGNNVQQNRILILTLAVALLIFFASAYALWAVSRRRFDRRNEFGVQLFRTARHAFWTVSIEDIVSRTATVSLSLSALASAACAVLLAITH